jgi:hypothetical protein
MNDKGWYCHATHTVAPGRFKPGGGAIELVQAVHATRGQIMKLNEAVQWLLDHGVATLDGVGAPPPAAPKASPASPKAPPSRPANPPISVDLVPMLTDLGTHPEFVRRGIGAATCRYLRCGLLAGGGSQLADRLVFQLGSVVEHDDGTVARVVLSHLGRATTAAQLAEGQKWRHYKGFNKSLELYNLDNLLLDPLAVNQVRATGHVLLVEGPFDTAKLVEAGIRNVVATMGAHLAADQLPRLDLIARRLGVNRFRVWYDRDQAGERGTTEALALLSAHGWRPDAFDWSMTFPSPKRGAVAMPETLTDPCDFSTDQLAWLRAQGAI